VGNKFLGVNNEYIAQLNPNGPAGSQFSETAWGIMPSDKAVVFLENHDTQRSGGIGYEDGDTYRLASVWMLAQPYGYPKVMSSYAFDTGPVGRTIGPPSDASGATLDVTCTTPMEDARIGDWVCEHRDPVIAGMVEFRRIVAGTAITGWWDNGANAIAFSRGDKGFVAMSLEDTTVSLAVVSSVPSGSYCDVLTGGLSGGLCTGDTVTVEPDGTVRLDLETHAAVAIHVGARP
jgi:alpha-amylase